METVDTLGVAAAWIEAHCVIPDQDARGEPFLLGAEQFGFVVNHYRVRRAVRTVADVRKPVDAFSFRRSQLVRAQKWGKSPLVAAFVCLEGVGPATFAGRASGGEVYECRAFGCPCGWGSDAGAFEPYVFDKGEPMGRPWSTPLIQITATTEDQTDNTYDALRPMIELGPLADVIPKTGEEFIRLPNGGRIDAVTSKANSRLGQRITFAAQDETGLWLASNGGHKLAKTQRRGLAGMGGRSIETTNAWNPAEESTAQQTFESSARDINKDFQEPPKDLDFSKKADRVRIFAFNYKAAPWVSAKAIEAEAAELLETDPADAERFFGNRIVAGSGAWFDMAKWSLKGYPVEVPDGARVCGGFDGSDNEDHTAIRLETLDGYQFTPTYGPQRRKAYWRPSEWNGRVPHGEVLAAWREIAERFSLVRVYWDPQFWESECDTLAAEVGERVFVKWATNRPAQIFDALERFRADVYNPDSDFTHDEDVDAEAHLRNAIVRSGTVDAITKRRRYSIGKASEPQKIDITMSGVLAHEARMDAVASGANEDDADESLVWF